MLAPFGEFSFVFQVFVKMPVRNFALWSPLILCYIGKKAFCVKLFWFLASSYMLVSLVDLA